MKQNTQSEQQEKYNAEYGISNINININIRTSGNQLRWWVERHGHPFVLKKCRSDHSTKNSSMTRIGTDIMIFNEGEAVWKNLEIYPPDKIASIMVILPSYFTTFKNLALIATITVLKDISTAPIAGLRSIPQL